MKKITPILIALVVLVSCEKDKLIDNPPELLIQVVDKTGNAVNNVKVELFASELDFDSRENIVAEATTDTNGEVLFNKNLEEIVYFVYASTPNKDNMYGVITYKNPLKINHKKVLKIIIKNKI